MWYNAPIDKLFIGEYTVSQKNKIRKLITMNTVTVAQGLMSLTVPGKVIGPNLSTGWTFVGEGSILRVQAAADLFVAFDDKDTDATAISASTSPAVKLPAGYHYVLCQNDYVKMSAAATRVELLEL